MSAAAAALIFRFGMLHFSDRITLEKEPDRHEYVRRGSILDSHGSILAMSVESRSLYANPSEIENPEDVAVKVSAALGMDESSLLVRLANTKKQFVWIKRRLTEEEVDRIAALDFKGLHYKIEYRRVYPHGSLASNLVGFVGTEGYGMEGIEYKYDNELISCPDSIFTAKDSLFRAGNSVVLTIDRVIQYQAEKLLTEVISTSGARQGAVIVTEVKSGKILALAKEPGYDPNDYALYTPFERSFFTVTEPFEPGSVMKIFSVATYSDTHPGVNPKYYCNGVYSQIDPEIKCTGVHGTVTLADSIRYSCNVGILSSMREIEAVQWYNHLRSYGFGERTLSGISGESSGIFHPVTEWSGRTKYSTAIGQEIGVTSLQLAGAYGAIASGGIYYSPYIVDSVVDSEGKILSREVPQSRGRVMSADLARALRKMLSLVVSSGTGRNAALAEYVAAGKTGTAQKSVHGVYVKGKNIASFAGFAPVENPDCVIVVIIDEPVGDTSGSFVAAPIFARLAERILPFRGNAIREKQKYTPVTTTNSGYRFTGDLVPEFRGRTLADALRVINAIQEVYPITPIIQGKGRVVEQSPAPGNAIPADGKIVIQLREE